jgi:hypothetical protein
MEMYKITIHKMFWEKIYGRTGRTFGIFLFLIPHHKDGHGEVKQIFVREKRETVDCF